MTTQNNDSGQGLQSSPSLPTSAQSPLKVGLTSAETAQASLTVSLGFPLKFVSEYVTKNVHIHDQIARKKETVRHLQTDNFLPRSTRFKFQLTAMDKTTKSPDFKALQAECDAALNSCQATLKKNILKARELEVSDLEKKQSKHCLFFILYLIQAYRLSSPDYTNINIERAFRSLMDSALIKAILRHSQPDEHNQALLEVFQTLESDVPEDVPSTLELVAQLYDVIKTTIVTPTQEYDRIAQYNKTWTSLQALDVTATTLKATENTVLQVDDKPNTSPKLLDNLITDKIEKKFHIFQSKMSKNQF